MELDEKRENRRGLTDREYLQRRDGGPRGRFVFEGEEGGGTHCGVIFR